MTWLNRRLLAAAMLWNDWSTEACPKLCEGATGFCLEMCGVQEESPRTIYFWEGEGPNPNRPPWLCRPCALEHHAFWDDMWSNVPGYGG